MENELTFTPVTDNSLLPFGETRLPLGDDNFKFFDITEIFEDNWRFGNAQIASIAVSTNGFFDLYGPGGGYQGDIDVLDIDLDTRPYLGLDEDAGVYFDTNEDRDSVVITWNKVAFFNQPEGPRQTFQAEIIDRQDGASEVIFRWADTNGERGYFVGMRAPYYNPANIGTNYLENIRRETPLFELDERIGNTGVAGVEQVLLVNGVVPGITVTGTEDGEVITGSGAADTLAGEGGNDTINGVAGNDTITGGAGDDEITMSYVRGSAPMIDGGDGNDTIRTQGNNETISGGGGDDLINAGNGANVIFGGAGDDIIRFGWRGRTEVDAGDGNDYIDGTFLDDNFGSSDYRGRYEHDLNGGAGNDTILGTRIEDEIAGQDGNDSVLAGGGRDMVFGGAGDDILTAGRDDDTIDGGAGDDFIFGALGRDVATGGEGADRFFVSGQDGDTMHILDYNIEEGDRLLLDGDLFDRDRIELRYSTALTTDGVEARGLELGYNGEDGFQLLFTFGNEQDLTQIDLRLPAPENGPIAPILFDLDLLTV